MSGEVVSEYSTVQDAKRLLDEAYALHRRIVEYHHRLNPVVQRNKMTEPEMTDVGFLNREIAAVADEVRKECEARQSLVGRLLCVAITRRSVEDPSSPLSSAGAYATASPDIKMRPILPKEGTPEYAEFLTNFGVGGAAVDARVFKLHYPRVMEWLTREQESGRPTPRGLVGMTPEPQVIFRRRRKDDADDQ